MNILHVLKNSLPYISGSTIRSKNILERQKEFADVVAYTGYNFEQVSPEEVINGISYFRGYSKLWSKYNKLIQKVRKGSFQFFRININFMFPLLEYPLYYHTKKDLKRLIRRYDIDVIHQHSEYQLGRFSLKIAKKLKIPFVYEVRAFLEDGIMVESENWRYQSERYKRFVYGNIQKEENKILKKAAKIIVLCPPMKTELLQRGIEKNKIFIVSNAIDNILQFTSEKLPSGSLTIGYIGTIQKHEGIEILIKAIPEIRDYVPSLRVILIGNVSDKYYDELWTLTKELGCEDVIMFIGVVPFDKIKSWYSVIDIIINPRLNERVCQMVSPIKPLESMASKTLIIASDLPAMRFYIESEKTGVLFTPESAKDLADKVVYYLGHPEKRKEIEDNAHKFVKENFMWEKNVKKYEEIYKNLIKEVRK